VAEDIFAQLAAIRQSLDEELKKERRAPEIAGSAIDEPPASERVEIEGRGHTKRNALCPCGSGKRFKHCHGQHQAVSRAEEPPPREITFSATVEISEVGSGEQILVDVVSEAYEAPASESGFGDAGGSECPDLQSELDREIVALARPTGEAEPQQEPERGLDEHKAPKAMKLIVAGHVKLRNRIALVDILAHRRKMLNELQAVSAISPANVVLTVLEEIALVEAALEEVKLPPGSLPENQWR